MFSLDINNSLISTEDVFFNIYFEEKFFDKNSPSIEEAHIHNFYEIYVNVSGDVSFLVESNVYPIKKGAVVITKPGDVHHCIFNSSCYHGHFCFWIKPKADSDIDKFFKQKKLPYVLVNDSEKSEMLISLLTKLCDAESDFDRTAYFFGFLQELDNNTKDEKAIVIPKILKDILEYMNENFAEIKRISDVASEFYISHATLNRYFRKYINLSPKEFLEAKKLSYAEQLLLQNLSITEVSNLAGFSDCSHFISVFKNRFGETPYKYRNSFNSIKNSTSKSF